MFASRCFTLMAMFGLASCIELAPVSPPAERPAVLHLSLRLSDAAAGGQAAALITVAATLDPGVDDIGRSRGILDDTLIVFGEPVPAVDLGLERGVYSETLLLELQQVFGHSFSIRAPVVENLPPFEFQVRWPLLEKGEPVPRQVEPGEELVLPLSREGFPGQPAPESQRWSLALFRESGWFSQGADGVPADQLVVPANLLGDPGTAMLAIVRMSNAVRVDGPDPNYSVRIELAQELRWNVDVAGPASNAQSKRNSLYGNDL